MKKSLIIFSISVLMIIAVRTAFSAFEDIGVGARPLGMGGAFVAVADDANAVAYNPAGLGYIKIPQIGFTHLRMFSSVVNYNFAGASVPIGNFGSLGLSFGILGEESGVYNEKNIAFSYSKKIIDPISIGLSLRMISTGFDEEAIAGNDYFSKANSSGVTFDVGLLAKPLPGLGIGFSGEGLAPVNISISESDEEKVPMNLRFGFSYNFSSIAESAQQPALKEILETTTISFEGNSRKEREINALKIKAGIEAWFANQTVALRAGYKMKKADETSPAITLGASVKIPVTNFGLQFDYALQIFGNDLDNNMAHRISVAMSL